MTGFDTKKLRMLTNDADDWDELIEKDWRNQENMIEGVLLYPSRGITSNVIEAEVKSYIENRPGFSQGSTEIHQVTKRGKDWAISYSVSAWYNHFDLSEDY